jgi:hypothetical protein
MEFATAIIYPDNPGASKYNSCSRFMRLSVAQLISRVTDMSRNHGHAT